MTESAKAHRDAILHQVRAMLLDLPEHRLNTVKRECWPGGMIQHALELLFMNGDKLKLELWTREGE